MDNKSHASDAPEDNNNTKRFSLESEQSTVKEGQSSAAETKQKKPSRLSKFLSKLQSPAVRAGSLMDEKDREEEKRTGVKKKDNSENPYTTQLVSDYRYVL
ncbi:hypothetical protein QBC40DRAFT_284601 [Triangularia verruculosa]|uniref:Uncharacterized protein n=1 Tax=Triangularia verruculosa TaxID=2587418 RepID=A0AAN6XG01_9PEZI|nr:hypothetical protein QBC40DRAFT_284601 [Triangularia verruculosa]